MRREKTPLANGTDYSRHERDELKDATHYRKLMGFLFHLLNTVRPHISFTVWLSIKIYAESYMRNTDSG